MGDFRCQFVKDHFPDLTQQEQEDVIKTLPLEVRQVVVKTLPPEVRLAGLSPEAIQRYLDKLNTTAPASKPKSRRKK